MQLYTTGRVEALLYIIFQEAYGQSCNELLNLFDSRGKQKCSLSFKYTSSPFWCSEMENIPGIIPWFHLKVFPL